MIEFLWGTMAMGCFIAGLFFLRFWRQTRDRLFLFFFLAFWTLTANWIVLVAVDLGPECCHHAYWIRLAGFLLLIVGILDKNWSQRRSSQRTVGDGRPH